MGGGGGGGYVKMKNHLIVAYLYLASIIPQVPICCLKQI